MAMARDVKTDTFVINDEPQVGNNHTLNCLLTLGGCPRMHFYPTLRYFHKNNARNITYMAALIFPKNLDLNKNAYSRTAS